MSDDNANDNTLGNLGAALQDALSVADDANAGLDTAVAETEEALAPADLLPVGELDVTTDDDAAAEESAGDDGAAAEGSAGDEAGDHADQTDAEASSADTAGEESAEEDGAAAEGSAGDGRGGRCRRARAL
jgi:hypothetical protein